MRLAWTGIAAVALALRLGPLLSSPGLVAHPDEYSFVFRPLTFFSGDANPHFFTYPTFLYYALWALQGLAFFWQRVAGAGLPLEAFVLYHYLWAPERLLALSRWAMLLPSLGAVAAAALVARRVAGPVAAVAAGLLTAVSPQLLRHAPLVAPDVPLACAFALATWGGVRLLDRDRLADYLAAGALVALATALKYPGALAGAAVLAAHLLARRSLRDGRLWAAGAAAIALFLAASPYLALDAGALARDLGAQVEQLAAGRGGDPGWVVALTGLRHGLGWPALLAAAAGAALVARRRERPGLVVLAAFGAFALLLAAGRGTFVRYGLPLIPLAAALAGVAVARLAPRRLALGAAAALAVVPGLGAMSTVRLLSAGDTRLEARRWVEDHVPEGTTCCNFGGWAGDVPLATFEQLAWRLVRCERAFGRDAVDRQLAFLEAARPPAPFYGYAVEFYDRKGEGGDLALADAKGCAIVLLHRHPLEFSRVDSAFAAGLARRAEPLARIAVPGRWDGAPRYDPLDAYYVPLAGGTGLPRPGPEIEVWRLPEYAFGPGALRARQVLARAYARTTTMVLALSGEPRSLWPRLELGVVLRALELEPGCPDVAAGLDRATAALDAQSRSDGDLAFALGTAHWAATRFDGALVLFERAWALGAQPALTAPRALDAARRLGRPDAVRSWQARLAGGVP